MNRRGFLGRALAAPWVVRSGVLMPIKPLVAAPVAGVAIARRYDSILAGDYGDVRVAATGDVRIGIDPGRRDRSLLCVFDGTHWRSITDMAPRDRLVTVPLAQLRLPMKPA